MRKFKEFKRIRTVLIIVAIIIAFISLFVSQSLVRDLSREEHSKMEVLKKIPFHFSLLPLWLEETSSR